MWRQRHDENGLFGDGEYSAPSNASGESQFRGARACEVSLLFDELLRVRFQRVVERPERRAKLWRIEPAVVGDDLRDFAMSVNAPRPVALPDCNVR